MGAQFSTVDAVLKEDYKSPIAEQLNNSNIMLAQMNRNKGSIQGRRFVRPIHTSRNSGVGARAENGTLPTAGNQGYVDIIGPCRYNYARIGLTGPIIEAMSSSKGAFTQAIESEVDGAVNDGSRDTCRQIWGESNGRLATCGTTTTSTTVVLSTATREDQYRTLEEGFLIDIGTLANPTSIASARSVTSVSRSTNSIVISGATVSTTSAAFVFRSGAGGASDNSGNPGDGQKEWTGIQTIVDDTAVLHTVNPATVTKWKATVNANGGTNRAISENLVTSVSMSTEVASGMMIDLLVGGDGVFRSYANLLTSLKRMNDTLELKGGFTAVNVGLPGQKGSKSVGLAWDRDCPSNRLYGFNTASFEVMEALDWDWISGPVDSILVQVGDTDAYTGTMRHYGEVTNHQRNANFVLKDITES